jgi:uncharacterized protein YlxP (DUF503 family)
MHAAAVRLELKIPDVRSLKQKRHRIKRLSARMSDAFSVSVSEVDHHDAWQRTTIGVALVASQAGHLERIIHSLQRMLLDDPEFELLEMGVAYMEEA